MGPEDDRRSAPVPKDLRDALAAAHDELERLRREVARRRRAGIGTESPVPERVGLFVDVQNMYYAARQLGSRLDYGALMNEVTRGRRLVRAVAYVVRNRDIDQSGFLSMLQQRNYEVRRKDLRTRQDGSSKGDWDMEIALDMLDLADLLDVAVLVSGDGDFAPLVERVKAIGPRVEVYSFPGSTGQGLLEAADRHVPIEASLLIPLPAPG